MLSKSERSGARLVRRTALVGGAVSLAALGTGLGAGIFAGANPPSTTNVKFVSLATPFKLETGKVIATNGTLSAVVIGGTTGIPTNATTVELNVTAGGTTAGVLNVYPTGNVAGGSGQSLSWSGGTTNTQTIQENVGLKDELTFALTGATAKLTATITGYSTQVTDGDVSGLDGTSGQVLTDNGSGAAWADPSIGAANVTATGGSAGQVLTNTGSGAQWKAVSTPLTWSTLTLQSGCTANFYGGGVPQIAVDASGVVHLRGEINCFTNENSAYLDDIATLPAGFAPSATEWVVTNLYQAQPGRLQINPSGAVGVQQSSTNPSGNLGLAFISLAGTSYTLPY
ncbi:MAG TPA: hypothetical protein VHS57_07170 [Acidimicrobiales bacterium]|nr:hypothetical protein [Acidimicrobiales bacterium]